MMHLARLFVINIFCLIEIENEDNEKIEMINKKN